MQVFLLIIQTNSPKIRGRLSEGFLSFKLHITRFLPVYWRKTGCFFAPISDVPRGTSLQTLYLSGIFTTHSTKSSVFFFEKSQGIPAVFI